MNWQPIDTAPKDKVIVTEDGFAIWSNKVRYGRVVGWIACDGDGMPYRCIEEGAWELAPNWWIVLPPLPKA